MLSDKDIQHRLLMMCQIVDEAHTLAIDSSKMFFNDSEPLFNFVNRNTFLSRVRTSLWKLSVIDLSKIFGSKNDHFSVIKLLHSLKEDHSRATWQNKISLNRIEELLSMIDSEDFKNRIKKLRELRDQHYSHKDIQPKSHIHSIKFYYTDIEWLSVNIKPILNELLNCITFDNYPFREYHVDEFNKAFRIV